MSSRADTALEHIHTLYLMQLKILDLLDQELNTPEARRTARAEIKEFQRLLRLVDWRYMGGEDVLESLKHLSSDMEVKLKGVKKRQRFRVTSFAFRKPS